MGWIILTLTATSLVSADRNNFVWDLAETTASWENPTSWSLGRVPNKYDDVIINEGRQLVFKRRSLRLVLSKMNFAQNVHGED